MLEEAESKNTHTYDKKIKNKQNKTGASMMALNVDIYINTFFFLVYGSSLTLEQLHDGVFHYETMHKPFLSLSPAVWWGA